MVRAAACLQISTVGFAQTTETRTGSDNIPSVREDIHGRVVDDNGKPLSGATVTVKETSKSTVTSKGKFTIQADAGQTLIISNAGYDDREIIIGSDTTLTIVLELNLASLLNTVVVNKGYYTTTQKLNTGNVSMIKASEIEEQPVGNPLAALAGRARFQTPRLDQRKNRVCTDFQLGHCEGRSRHGAPLLKTQRIALTMTRFGVGRRPARP